MEEVEEEEVEEEVEGEALAHGGGEDRANSVQSQAYDRIIQVGNQTKQKLSLHNSFAQNQENGLFSLATMEN